jgi:tRNA 2-selenouridine synthase SelU
MIINTIFGNYECREFTNVDPDENGIDISKNENHIGSMIGFNLPEDEEDSFIEELEIWLAENEQ